MSPSVRLLTLIAHSNHHTDNVTRKNQNVIEIANVSETAATTTTGMPMKLSKSRRTTQDVQMYIAIEWREIRMKAGRSRSCVQYKL